MDLFLAGQRVRLNDSDLLGEGGEARVYRWKDLAVKVFHPVPPGQPAAAAVRDQKLLKLARFPKGLPASVVSPLELAKDRKDAVVGYAMRAVEGGEDFARLSQRKWREQVVANPAVMGLFQQLAGTLRALHGQGVVAGDLNDGNVLFCGGATFLIDADSMQFDGLPCAVGHERFLDPRLYGVDLLAAPRFDAGTDWYSFAVMLFSSLLYVHPFGGTHAKLPTLLRRAEARHSILRPDVMVPRLAVAPKVLPDDALAFFQQVFEKDLRSAPPESLLQLGWTRCGCGLEHARAVCPECHTLGPLVTRQVLRSQGRCTARTAFQTTGRVLFATMQGGLRYVAEEHGATTREDGSLVRHGDLSPGLRFAISGPSTWVADGRGRLERIVNGKVVEQAQTQVRGTVPVLAASSSSAYRQENEWLIEQFSGTRVGQVLEGQTWLWTGERLGLGFYRAGGFTCAFLLQTGRAGLRRLEGVSWTGRLVEADATFDARHALLTVVTEAGGVEQVHRWLFDEAGALVGQGHGGSRGHAAILNGRVVLATDSGLCALKLDGGHLLEALRFPDTQPFVSAGDELLPQPDGSLYVVGSRDITQLTLT